MNHYTGHSMNLYCVTQRWENVGEWTNISCDFVTNNGPPSLSFTLWVIISNCMDSKTEGLKLTVYFKQLHGVII